MALSLPYTLTAGTPENVNHVQSNFTTLANSFPLAINTTNFATVPQCRVYRSTNQTLSTAMSVILFDSETVDSGTPSTNMHDTGSNTGRLTCRVAGGYLILANTNIQANSANAQGDIYLNGTTILSTAMSPSMTTGVLSYIQIATFYRLAVNDYVETRIQASTGTPLCLGGASTCNFSMIMVSV